MSKKLKKKIEELCGLANLGWEARQERASDILANNEWKQQICNELQGLSFRDLEKHLSSVRSERQKKEDSYERKLKTYKKGTAHKKQEPLQRDSTVPKRTLAEILAQVYAPRVVQGPGFTDDERRVLAELRAKRVADDILSDTPSDDGDTNK